MTQSAALRVAKTPTSRDHQREATRARVLDAARALFAERGYEQATIRDIARRAGVAPGSVFTTFESKAELLQEITYARYEDLTAELSEGVAAQGSLLTRLKSAFAVIYRYESQHIRLLAESIGASWTWTREMDIENRARISAPVSVVQTLVTEAVAHGHLRQDLDPVLFTEMIVACYLHNFRRAIFDDWSPERLTERMERQLRVLLDGALAPAETEMAESC